MGLARIDLKNYTLDLVRKDSGTLVVSFESMGPSMANPSRDRPGWGFRFLASRDESVLFVKPSKPNWYRRPDFHRWLDRNAALFAAFDRVVLVGASMGGYGALAFAEPMRATGILALNPQSTLAPDLVPWEDRFPRGLTEDWSGPYRDGAAPARGKLFVVADRYEALDMRHVNRLKSAFFYNFPFVGHIIPIWLSQVNGLKPLMRAVIDGRSPARVGKILSSCLRKRRSLEIWWTHLFARAASKNSLHRLAPFLARLDPGSLVEIGPTSETIARMQSEFRAYLAAHGNRPKAPA